MLHQLIHADCLNYLKANTKQYNTIFADGPDNIGLKYKSYKDNLAPKVYLHLVSQWLDIFVNRAKTVWFSYNSKWTFEMGGIITELLNQYKGIEAKSCVQIFTFGQYNQHDLGNNHRPLLRLRHSDAPLYPDAIRVPSWRQTHGDKRADPRGRIPSDVFNFPRVTGNSKQRRSWHPTQLGELLVERCLKLTSTEGDDILDPFAGTGTTLRVCKRLNMNCTLIECDSFYCSKLAEEHNLRINHIG